MTEKVEKMLDLLKKKEYRKLRENGEMLEVPKNVKPTEFASLFRLNADPKSAIIYENDDFGFNRGTTAQMGGAEGNFTPNYFKVIAKGLDAIKEEIEKTAEKTADMAKKERDNDERPAIKTLPNAYNMEINEETSNISQGQKQLLTMHINCTTKTE